MEIIFTRDNARLIYFRRVFSLLKIFGYFKLHKLFLYVNYEMNTNIEPPWKEMNIIKILW